MENNVPWTCWNKEGIQKLLIVGRVVIYNDTEIEMVKNLQISKLLYPTGLDPEATVFFQSENIDEVYLRMRSWDEEKIYWNI